MKRKNLIVLVTTGAVFLAGAGWMAFSPKEQLTGGQKTERLHCDLPPLAVSASASRGVWVPGGSFEFGDVRHPGEPSVRKTNVTGFWMDRTEVTNDEFSQFVKATGYVTSAERDVDSKLYPDLPAEMSKPGAVVFMMPKVIRSQDDATQWWRYIPGASWRHPGGPSTKLDGRGSFPVVAVTYEDAAAYAAWMGRVIPTEAQWEWAARAAQATSSQEQGQPKEANTWQGLFPMVNSGEDGFLGLAPVGCYPPNALGLFDMIGNVWELTADSFSTNRSERGMTVSDQVPPGLRPTSTGQHVIKGGSYLCAPNYCVNYRAGARQPQDDDLSASHLGFRTILIAPGP